MREIERRCRTAKLFTSTNESNIPMQALLRSLGYVPSTVIHQFDPGDPELVYFLDLSGRAAQHRMEAWRHAFGADAGVIGEGALDCL